MSGSSSSSDEDVKATGVEGLDKSGLTHRGGGGKDATTPEVPKKPEKKHHKSRAGGGRSFTLPSFITDPNNPIGWAVSSTQDFAADSIRLVRRCTKPDAREFKKIAYACAIGFLLMGVIGYVVKLVFIPVNNIIVGG